MWDVCSNITDHMSSVDSYCMWDVCSNIVIGLSVLDMLSVLFVMYVGRMF